jgi:hypothetical protein
MKPLSLLLLLSAIAPVAQAQLAEAPRPLIRLYHAGLAEGIALDPGNARCIIIRSFDAAEPKKNAPDSLRAGAFLGTAMSSPQSIDSFCYDDARRLVRYRSFSRGKDGMALAGNYDASFVTTDSGLLQTISYADMPGTTVTTLSNNDEIIWSHTFGRGMLAVQEQHARFGDQRIVTEKSFLLPWHRKRIEEPLAGGGWRKSTFVPRGTDTTTASIQIADYDAQHRPLASFTLTPIRGSEASGRLQYDTSHFIAYRYDKTGRLTAAGNDLKVEYNGAESWPQSITESQGSAPVNSFVRYKLEDGRITQALVYERMALPKSAKPANYYELRRKIEVSYLP